MDREKVIYETNVPVVVAFEKLPGELQPGKFGDEYRYWLEDNRITWVKPELHERIEAMRLEPGEPISVCKRELRVGQQRRIEWQIERVDLQFEAAVGRGPDSHDEPEQPTGKRDPFARFVEPAAAAPVSQPRTNGAAHGAAPQAASPAALLFTSMQQAIDAALLAERYAAEKGFPLRFSSEDMRCLALSIYIGKSREGGIR